MSSEAIKEHIAHLNALIKENEDLKEEISLLRKRIGDLEMENNEKDDAFRSIGLRLDDLACSTLEIRNLADAKTGASGKGTAIDFFKRYLMVDVRTMLETILKRQCLGVSNVIGGQYILDSIIGKSESIIRCFRIYTFEKQIIENILKNYGFVENLVGEQKVYIRGDYSFVVDGFMSISPSYQHYVSHMNNHLEKPLRVFYNGVHFTHLAPDALLSYAENVIGECGSDFFGSELLQKGVINFFNCHSTLLTKREAMNARLPVDLEHS